jgi:hypothetical protein
MPAETLLEHYGRELLLLRRHDGCSCLHISVYMGHAHMVHVLLGASRGLGLEAALLAMTTTDGSSCLLVSAQLGHPLITRPLLEAGGRELLSIKRKDGTSCLAVVRNNVARMEQYYAMNLQSDHKRVLCLIEKAYQDWGLELE